MSDWIDVYALKTKRRFMRLKKREKELSLSALKIQEEILEKEIETKGVQLGEIRGLIVKISAEKDEKEGSELPFSKTDA
jgi:hypothetical protein